MSSDLIKRLKKVSTIQQTEIITKSEFINEKDMIPTPVPMMNVALSGRVDGGLYPGLTILAGPSKHFKTLFALVIGASFLRKYKDGVILFYDSEFGTPLKYFEALNMDTNRIVHTPITNIEILKNDISNQLDQMTRDDKVCIIIDSIGNLASKKEVEDAMDGKSVADMSRAKALKSLFRIVTPQLTMKDIPMIAVNHSYNTLEMYSKPVMSGGTGPYYSAGDIWMIGRQQDKDEKTKLVDGYHFIINIEKSRLVKEKSKIPISVSYENGINRWSGLLENALEAKIIGKPIAGRYERLDDNGVFFGKRYTEEEIIHDDELWTDILKTTSLANFIREKYSTGGSSLLEDTNDVHTD